MVEVRDTEKELHRMQLRLGLALLFVVTLFGLLVARFVYLQVYKYSDFYAQAEDNRITLVPVPPSRGLVFDRKGLLMAENVAGYTLELAPSRIRSLDETVDALSKVIDIPQRDKRRFKKLVEEIKNADFVPLKTRLSDEEVAKMAAVVWRYPGVEVRARLFRNYPNGESASHILGYISRLSPDDQDQLEEKGVDNEYIGTTHIGKTGIEQSYESVLHGKAGYEEVEVSAGGRGVRTLSRNEPTPGQNLVLSIDLRLQQLIEELYGDRMGALVAIEPKTGEVLAFVSKPTFDPNLFIDGIDSQSWAALNDNPNRPLLNRPLRGTYPPGSTYKPFLALAALTTGVRTPEYTLQDTGFYSFGGRKFRDSVVGGNGSVNIRKSIVVSSDTYYYMVAHDMGVDTMHDQMAQWGFGSLTGIDLNNEAPGVLPSSAWKLKRFKQKWFPGETISLGIGQGYNAFTILQLAHAAAALANDGVVMKPKLVMAVEDPVTRQRTPSPPELDHKIPLSKDYLQLIKGAMVDVTKYGTSRIPFQGAEYQSAGKTGTAQVVSIKQNEKYDARKIAVEHRDHSLYMAYAPADDPKIAIALIVENGGFGAMSAAPIARKALDYYLLGKLPKDLPDDSALLNRPEIEEQMRDVPDEIETDDTAPAPATPPAAVTRPASPVKPGLPAAGTNANGNAAGAPSGKPGATAGAAGSGSTGSGNANTKGAGGPGIGGKAGSGSNGASPGAAVKPAPATGPGPKPAAPAGPAGPAVPIPNKPPVPAPARPSTSEPLKPVNTPAAQGTRP